MNNTIQMYADKEKQVKAYPITSPDRVLDENGTSIKKQLRNNVKFNVVSEGVDVPEIDGQYDDTEIKKQIKNIKEQVDYIANKGTTVHVLERVTKEEIDRQIKDGTIANLTIEDNSITEEKLKCTVINKNEFGVFNPNKTHSWVGFKRTVNDDGSLTVSYTNDQENRTLVNFSHNLDVKLQPNHRYYVATDIILDDKSTLESLDFSSVNFSIHELDTNDALSKGTTQKDVRIKKDERKSIKFILTTREEFPDVQQQYVFYSIDWVEPNQTISCTFFNIFIYDMGVVDEFEDEHYRFADEIFNKHGYTGRRVVEAETRNTLNAETAIIANNLKNFDKNDYVTKNDMRPETVTIFENKLNFNPEKMDVWVNYHPSTVTGLNINFTNNEEQPNIISISYPTDFKFIPKHKYFIAIDLELNECTQVSDRIMDFHNLILSGTTGINHISSYTKKDSIITVGSRKNLKFEFEITEEANNYETHYIRFLPIDLNNGQTLNMTVHNICVVDMEGKTYSKIDNLFNKYGYTTATENLYNIKVEKSKTAEVAETAKSVKNIALSTDIEVWGDSLVGQMYGDIIARKLGRTVLSYGYGGKKSAYIRDKFLELSNKENTIIINVGTNDAVNHNDLLDVDNIITNIRMMVNAIPHNRFLICTPANGGHGKPLSLNGGKGDGDYKGGAKHQMLCELERRLSLEYQGHYLNTRESCIYGYDMGGVHLLQPFTQPNIGSRVQISVSDATFLTTYNPNDLDDYGEEFMKQIRIGSLSKADRYKVISKDSDTLLTVELVEANKVTPGQEVANGVDDGGTHSIMYLKVVQECDYQCFIGDTTASTFRKDKIHMSDRGLEDISNILCRAITRNCI